jgi:hypothetical protein
LLNRDQPSIRQDGETATCCGLVDIGSVGEFTEAAVDDLHLRRMDRGLGRKTVTACGVCLAAQGVLASYPFGLDLRAHLFDRHQRCPTKISPAASQARTKPAFSERNPSPGWIASAPLCVRSFHAASLAGTACPHVTTSLLF